MATQKAPELEDMEQLVRKRASYKGQLTTFKSFMTKVSDSSLTSAEAGELQLRTAKFEELYNKFDEVQLTIECLEKNYTTEERSEFENLYFKLLARAQDYLRSHNKQSSQDDESNSCITTAQMKKPRLVKLPTISLPKFNGSYDQWLEFRDTFSSLIDSVDDIDPINKFHYLRASLEGSAAVVIQSIEFSASGYSVAWKLLCDRYDNKRLLIQNHISSIFNIDAITKESSVALKRLTDQINKNLRALELLGEPVNQWDTLLIYIITQKIDAKTFREWEECKGRLDKEAAITFDIFLSFLRNHADLIETIESSRNKSHNQNQINDNKQNPKIKTLFSVQESGGSVVKPCPKCNGEHALNNCSQFLALSNEARLAELPQFKACFNCLRSGHFSNRCKRPGCKICKRKHNTLVHVSNHKQVVDNSTTKSSSVPVSSVQSVNETKGPESFNASIVQQTPNLTLSASLTPSGHNQECEVLLSTALVKLYDNNNREIIARALLDSGSTACLITEHLSNQLGVTMMNVDQSIVGINNITSRIGKVCNVTMKSLHENYKTKLRCFVLPTITDNVPTQQLDVATIQIPSNLCLADPNFHSPASIDLILGADIFWDLLGSQHIKLGMGKPVLQETRLGWIVSGRLLKNASSSGNTPLKCNFVKTTDIQDQLTRFWQLEEVCPQMTDYSPEEKLCEEHFIKNTTRQEDGRFCVQIPLKGNPNLLGQSFRKAEHCLVSLERRLKSQPKLNDMYRDFMSEYEALGHMSPSNYSPDSHDYYIPHHGVLRESSSTTKLRVVFNASSPTTSRMSSNDIQMVGPTVQDNLISLLLRFRMYTYVLTADVEKMYRCVMVNKNDRYLQKILWRKNPNDESPTVYELNTVTYGTASAPFLATRVLKQIGVECNDKRMSDVIMKDFYVDDLVTGTFTKAEALEIRKGVTQELASAGMNLRKWKSNDPQLASDMPSTRVNLDISSAANSSKILGLAWDTNKDNFQFPIKEFISNKNTKRDILSTISQICDPLGLLAPCVINMKMLLQKLWLEKLDWDQQIPPTISKEWADILTSLATLNDLNVPRMVTCNGYRRFDLHIFADASERAYGACAYVRTFNESGEVWVRLLFAKSRVAPLKPTTIPRLELCAALVAARIYEMITNSLRGIVVGQVTFWTDSMIVLGWLKMLPIKLQPFVRNRVAEILDKTGSHNWRHVPTHSNPADLISRGVDVKLITSIKLWWTGPSFLIQNESEWPAISKNSCTLPELKSEVSLYVNKSQTLQTNVIIDFNRFSNYTRLIRTVAYIQKFINLCKKQIINKLIVTKDELNRSLKLIIKISQQESFPEYELLINQKQLPKGSSLLKLNVFLDKDNLIRVGGRLENSTFTYDKKHPIVLQSNHRFTKLLFNYEHKKQMHAGPQLLLATIRNMYWPIGGRNLAKTCYHACVVCHRMKGQVVAPLMGNLPQQRLESGGHPFESVGVDYAGPILSANRQGRGCRLVKVYIAIFICFATKAVHIELVGDLTSSCYLQALRRFMSRRGKPVDIFSDNGTSFVGAYNELSKFLKENCNLLAEAGASEGTEFHFIPSYSPHFGGLWEAGVKSIKYHLQRVLGNCKLTYEELYSTLVQIEAILNSRPITPLSSDPDDMYPLTPGHFLIGRPITSLPTRDLTGHSYDHLARYERIEHLRQQFWSRWSSEYVSELQQRTKWKTSNYPLKLNALVLIKEDNLPPLKWRLGRITAIHPGADGVCRVADIKTTGGVVRRSFSKICPLPLDDVSVESASFNVGGHVQK